MLLARECGCLLSEAKGGVANATRAMDYYAKVGETFHFEEELPSPNGKVIAQDIFPDFLDKAKARASGRSNVEFVLGATDDPKLPAGRADIILMLDVYHHVDYPAKVLASLKKALKPGGRLVVVEYYKRPEAMPGGRALEHIRLDEDDAIREIEENGFNHLSRSFAADTRINIDCRFNSVDAEIAASRLPSHCHAVDPPADWSAAAKYSRRRTRLETCRPDPACR